MCSSDLLRPEDLRYWSDVTKDWVADQAVFDVTVGGSSAAPFNNSFTVVGN